MLTQPFLSTRFTLALFVFGLCTDLRETTATHISQRITSANRHQHQTGWKRGKKKTKRRQKSFKSDSYSGRRLTLLSFYATTAQQVPGKNWGSSSDQRKPNGMRTHNKYLMGNHSRHIARRNRWEWCGILRSLSWQSMGMEPASLRACGTKDKNQCGAPEMLHRSSSCNY